eukprot:1921887-Rhodomonas_salina.2
MSNVSGRPGAMIPKGHRPESHLQAIRRSPEKTRRDEVNNTTARLQIVKSGDSTECGAQAE